MRSPEQLYPVVVEWLKVLGVVHHRTALDALAHLVSAVLVCQSLRPADVMRAWLSEVAVPARTGYRRRARGLDRPWLTSATVTPGLVRAVLALVAPDPAGCPTAGQTHLVLDSVRGGAWEFLTLGVAWHSRVLPIAWAVLPYPWPKGQFGPLVCRLVRQVGAVWPAERPVQLVADRAFPSRALLLTLQALGWGWTLRLAATRPLTVAGQPERVRDRLAGAPSDAWTSEAVGYGHGETPIPGRLVIGRGDGVVPAHQAGPASQRQRAQQQTQRARHLRHKHPGRPDASAQTDAWVVLFTTQPTVAAARASYRRRWTTEGTYRDLQGGWDGHHGWQLEDLVEQAGARQRPERLDALLGLWAVATLVQTWLGVQVSDPEAPAAVQAVVRGWTTTGRLSVWAHGHFALTERSGRLTAWLTQTLLAGAAHLALAPPVPTTPPTPILRRLEAA